MDAKRGDIDSTAQMYAKESFIRYNCDVVTVNPYMGFDSLKPFIEYKDKGTIVLIKTSNASSGQIQDKLIEGKKLFISIAQTGNSEWNANKNLGFVIGSTYSEDIKTIREMCPDIPFLVPGVGAQGGNIAQTINYGKSSTGFGLIINSSRGIIYAGKGKQYANASLAEVDRLNQAINKERNPSSASTGFPARPGPNEAPAIVGRRPNEA